ncbi:hypothetical protein IM793_06075 [Pedobacter sp. MR2016-19]|uniref:hypothetical protein n=1 Tax=Pedobacter sp. MR2016-19 TaxID=2780089 RepID=UPI0018737A89|nr:hypothetical protein [Pedobacter sp. MR2016-19]MBE5318713.1 hypothetical protein [Pedobacter sp. MR2016-19]
MKNNKKAILGFAFSMLASLAFLQGMEMSAKNPSTNQVGGAVAGYMATGEASGAALGAVAGAATAGSGLLTGAAFGAVICPWCAVGAVALGA